jgi:hypothetical protein
MANKLPQHLFVSECDGSLYDTRNPNCWSEKPLRTNYCRTHREIESVADLKATLRNGPYAWPGGYPMALILSDGGCISFKTALAELRYLVDALRDYKTNQHERSGWRPIGCDILWEGTEYDSHTGEQLETAYGPTEELESEV